LFSANADLWLEIAVDTSANGSFEADETFAPRLKLASIPYAHQAKNAAAVSVPLALSGSAASPNAILSATNTADGYAGYFSGKTGVSGNLTIEGTGKLGVGTTDLDAKLEVNGLARVQGAIWPSAGKGMELAYSSGQHKGYIQVYDRDTSSWGNLYLGDGNVGIGTGYPSEKLEVAGNVKVTGSLSAPVTRTIVLPAGALNIDGNPTWSATGITFPQDPVFNVAGATVPMPKDWDGTSDFIVTFFFSPSTHASGIVRFFVRITGRSVGEFMGDPGSIMGPGVSVGVNKRAYLFKQSITVPASNFSTNDDVIHIFGIQRDDATETYTDDVWLRAVEISYTAKR
jgi:hypothetical protein